MLQVLLGITMSDTCTDELAHPEEPAAQSEACANKLQALIEAVDSRSRLYVSLLPQCVILFNGVPPATRPLRSIGGHAP